MSESAPAAKAEGTEAQATKPAATPSEDEDVWKEDYEEHIDAEPEPELKPRKRRGRGRLATIIIVIVLLFMVVWTLASPDIVPQSGEVYTDSPRYANLGSYLGWRATWAANTTWGISVGGGNTTSTGEVLNIRVLITKVEEHPGNWFMRGTAITLRNVSVYNADGVFMASMSNWTDLGFGLAATVPLVFSDPGVYELYVYVRFMVFIDMRIGFLPVEAIEVHKGWMEEIKSFNLNGKEANMGDPATLRSFVKFTMK
ncbi:MAG: hypothetical protein QXT42_03985, partial [Thermoplasmata archaeon]